MTEYLTKEFPYQARSFVSCAQIGERRARAMPSLFTFSISDNTYPLHFFRADTFKSAPAINASLPR